MARVRRIRIRSPVVVMAPLILALLWIAFQRFQVQTMTIESRVRYDLRALGSALEAFHTKNGAYPDAVSLAELDPNATPRNPNSSWRLTMIPAGRDAAHPGVTTPVAYLPKLPYDYYGAASWDHSSFRTPYAYYNDGKGGWIVYSAGPDCDYDIDPPHDYDPAEPLLSTPLFRKTYDPTNGTASNGDIYRVKD